MKTAWYIMCAVVIVLIGLNFYQCDRKKEVVIQQDNREFEQTIAGLQSDTAVLRTALREKRATTLSDSTKSAGVVLTLKRTIVQLKATAASQRPDVQPILDSIPKLRAFVALQDSIISEQGKELDTLHAAYTAQVRGLNEQIKLHEQIQAKTDSAALAYQERVAELLDKSRKSERRKRFWRSTTLIAAGGVLALILAK